MFYIRNLQLNFFMSRAEDFDGKNAAVHNSSKIDFTEHLKSYHMQYDQRNRINATRALYDLVYGSYMYFKKSNATYDKLCV
jgi:hypothetical protein